METGCIPPLPRFPRRTELARPPHVAKQCRTNNKAYYYYYYYYYYHYYYYYYYY